MCDATTNTSSSFFPYSTISTPKANMKMNGTNFESNAEKCERVRKAKPSDSSELSGYRVVPIDHGYILPHILRISDCSFFIKLSHSK